MDDNGTDGHVRPPLSAARQHTALPLAAWAAALVAIAILLVVLAIGIVLKAGGDDLHAKALTAGLGVGAVAVAVAALITHRVGADVRKLSADAANRARHSSPSPRLSATTDRMSELHTLARLMDALQLRARVAEEMAEQAQRTSHTASLGMFQLLSGLVAAEEATRGQLSADLHDTVAQTLAAARAILANPEGQPGAWERVRELTDDAEEEVRAVMARARPPELREGDLASAVVSLRREMAARYLLKVDVIWPEEPRPLPLVAAVTVYRFFQEALLNVIKHADVDEATASLDFEDELLIAQVRDEGPGFDPRNVRSSGGRHVGLGLLRERARLAGGVLDVASEPGRGTTLTLRLPVRPASAVES